MMRERFETAAALHGHRCPGLAIGVRAAAEALRLLAPTEERDRYCIAESRACYLDGVQSVFGTTWGNGRLELRESGKTAFNFYDRAAGRGLRMLARDWPEGLSREEMIDFLLSAPAEEVFTVGEPAFEAPPDVFRRHRTRRCARCGEDTREPFLRLREGELVCLACAEKE